MEEDGGGGLIDFLFALVAADVGGDEEAVGLGGGEALIPCLHRDSDSIFEHGDEILDFEGGGAVAAVHVAGKADYDQFDLLLMEHALKLGKEIREGFARDETDRLGDHLEFVAEGDAHAFGAVVDGEDAHKC